MATLQVSSEVEACASDSRSTTTAVHTGLLLDDGFVCPVSFYWEPSRWLRWFDANVQLSSLPVAGYYCPSVCAQFPTPAGYQMQQCQLVDMDECAAAQHAGASICGLHATCINTPTRTATDLGAPDPPHGTLNSTGYLCICRLGYFTVQMFPTACHDRGLEMAYFMTEEAASYSTHLPLANDTANTTTLPPAISTMYRLKTARQLVLANIQALVPGINSSVSLSVFAASSVFTDTSITFETPGTSRVWKVSMRLASAFVQMQDSTLKRMAIVIHDTLLGAGVMVDFQLHTQNICNGDDSTLQNVCSDSAMCAVAGIGACTQNVAYVQAHLVHTNSGANSVDSQSAGFVMRSVRFNMATQEWSLQLQFEDRQDGARRVLFVSKTRQLHGVTAYSDRMDHACASHQAGGQSISDTERLQQCFSGFADTFHVLQSYTDNFATTSGITAQQLQRLQSGFSGYQDFSTGSFTTLPSATAHEAAFADLSHHDPSVAVAAGQPLLVTRTRLVWVTLSYDEVVQLVGKHTAHGADNSNKSVEFFVGMATMRVADGLLSTVVTTRDILTRIDNNYVLTHDTTDANLDNMVIPFIAVSLFNVHSRSIPTSSWGFIRYDIRLPPSAVAAGITFDQEDVIPVDSVIGSIAFFQDDPIDTNAYPCIFRPSVDSYESFAAEFGCSDAIQSVSLCLCRTPAPSYATAYMSCVLTCTTCISFAPLTLHVRHRSAGRSSRNQTVDWSTRFRSGRMCWTTQSTHRRNCS